jgi:uncharacterized FlaG/YvyC family protein
MVDAIGTTSGLAPDLTAGVSAAAPTTSAQPVQSGQSSESSNSPASTDGSSTNAATKVVVEQGNNKAVMVFKVLDRHTGEILAEIPRQEARKTASDPTYQAGAFYNEKA